MVLNTRQYYPLFSQWTLQSKKTPKPRFTVGFCFVCQNRHVAILLTTCYVYCSLSPKPFRWLCQLVCADTKRPRAAGGGAAAVSKVPPGWSGAELHTGWAPSRRRAPVTGRTVPQTTFPKVVGNSEKRKQTAGSPGPSFHRKRGCRWHGNIKRNYSI